MLSYALRPETWATTRLELEGRGVSRCCAEPRCPGVRPPSSLSPVEVRPGALPCFRGSEVAPLLLEAPVPALPQARAAGRVAPATPRCRAEVYLLSQVFPPGPPHTRPLRPQSTAWPHRWCA